MARFIVDTDTLSLWQRGHPMVVAAAASAAQASPADVATTIITVEEQCLGRVTTLRRATRPDQIARAYLSFAETVRWLSRLEILTFSEPAVLRFEQLVTLKLRVGGNDLRIAAIALEHGATVVTRNKADFARVPGLTIVDWSV
jgi:tRNA(fMet)-specific endonuclease VapC